MNVSRLSPFFAAIFACLAIGCTAEVVDDIEGENDSAVAAGELPLEGSNALNLNALNLNALNLNALNLNALNLNALNLNALDSTALSSIEDPSASGDLARQALRYMVGCALDTTQSFSFTWTDDQGMLRSETYWGTLGLATTWANSPLNPVEQQWVSACLAARVNWYGVSVMISSRGAHSALNKSQTSEITQYPKNEGAFWGNLFGAAPHVYACHYSPNTTYSRLKMRDCAAGHVDPDGSITECGVIEIVGACETYCSGIDPNNYHYKSCASVPTFDDATTRAITVYLP
jgi:hypothetical protein